MSLRNKCILLIFLITNSVLQTVQAGKLYGSDNESDLSEYREELRAAHPDFFNPGPDFDPIPSGTDPFKTVTFAQERIRYTRDVTVHDKPGLFIASGCQLFVEKYIVPADETLPEELPDLDYQFRRCLQPACDYFGILHVGGNKMKIPLKEPVSFDVGTGEIICEFSSRALRCIWHHRANVTFFKFLYAKKPNMARLYLKRKKLPLEGPIFDQGPAGSFKNSSKSDRSSSQRSDSSTSATNRLLSKLSKSPTFISGTCSQMVRRLHQSPTYNNLTRGLSKSSISGAYNGVVRSLSKVGAVTQVSNILKSGGSTIKRWKSRAGMLKKTNS